MGRLCPVTGEYVLYPECLECETRGECAPAGVAKPVFALLIAGSRSVTDYQLVSRTIDRLIAPIRNKYDFLIVSGGARGVDSMAETYARQREMSLRVMPADWKRYGKAAGYIRNEEMHRYISTFEHRGAVAFWDGQSKGTAHSFDLAEKYKNPLRVIRV